METFIDPRTLARVKDMPLIAKTVAEGFLHGLQPSQQRGIGIEFSQYRSYEPGDELNRIDWKLFARSDRYFVHEAERESETKIWFVLDASASMAHQSQDNQTQINDSNWSKFDYSRHLIATLAYLALKQGDSVGFIGLSTASLSFLPPQGGDQQWHAILQQLHSISPGNKFPNKRLLTKHINEVQKPGLVFFLSDFYQEDNEISDLLTHIGHGQSEVVALHMQCNDELVFPYKGAVRFQDLESNEQVLISATTAKASYLQAMQAHLLSIKKHLSKSQVDYYQVNTSDPLDQVLFDYLSLRAKGLD